LPIRANKKGQGFNMQRFVSVGGGSFASWKKRGTWHDLGMILTIRGKEECLRGKKAVQSPARKEKYINSPRVADGVDEFGCTGSKHEGKSYFRGGRKNETT